MITIEAARRYLEKKFSPIPVHNGKNPGFPRWQSFRTSEATLDQDFQGTPNIGLQLGEPSGGLVDVDLDCTEARDLAPSFLPATAMVGGREHSPRSHLYFRAPDVRTEKFVDPSPQKSGERAVIVELRSTGSQTLVAPSIHPTGDRYVWNSDGDPLEVPNTTLRASVRRLAACVVVSRNWQRGKRHELALALTGTLLTAGWNLSETEHFIQCAARQAGDNELGDRSRAIRDTATTFALNKPVSGVSALRSLLDRKTVSCLLSWLMIPREKVDANSKFDVDVSQPNAYAANGHGFIFLKPTKAGPVPVPICNFTAQIEKDITEDDGTETRHLFEIAVHQNGRSVRGPITADELMSGKWPLKVLGASAVVFPRMNDHLRCAVQLMSPDLERLTVFTHTGWRKVEGYWVYLHSDGAIGSSGRCSAAVRLDGVLSSYCLPEPPSGSELHHSYRHVLDLVNVTEEGISISILGAVFCAILGDCDFSIHLEGETGAGKTALAALFQSFFGKGFDSTNLPGSWASSANSLELMAYIAKDSLFVIDDFKPGGTAQDKARSHREADRVFRAQANRAGRSRLSREGSLRMERPPRGVILSTGEDTPFGESLRARLLVLEALAARMNWKNLSGYQLLARSGEYAKATSGLIRWIAGRFDQLRGESKSQLEGIRDSIAASLGSHKRTPTTIAFLIRGWSIFLQSALEEGCIDDQEFERWNGRIREVLLNVGRRQGEHQRSQEPTGRFVELLTAVLSGERGHLVTADGGRPDENRALGWRKGDGGRYDPQGKKIGWIKDDFVYLLPDAAYAATLELSASTGDPIAASPQALWKRMHEKGLLAATDVAGRTLRVRRKLEGKEVRVIAILKTLLMGNQEDEHV